MTQLVFVSCVLLPVCFSSHLEAINSIKRLPNGCRRKQTVKHVTQTQVESLSLQISQKNGI